MGKAQYLEAIIRDSGLKKQYLADKCGMTRQSFTTKCKDPSSFTAANVAVLCKELKINSMQKAKEIFFA